MIYEDNFKNYSSYFYDPKVNFEDLNDLQTPYGMNEGYLNDFEYSLRKGKIKILRSSYLGWVGGNNSKNDLDYTFKQYWKKILELLKDENYRKTIEKRRGFYNDANEKERKNDQKILDKEEQKIAQVAQQKREAEQKAAQQKREAEQKAAQQKREAEQKAAQQKREAEQKAAQQKREAEQKAAQQKREAEQKAAAEERERKNNFIKNQNIPDIKSRNYSFFKILGDYKIIDTSDYSLAALKSSENWDENQFMEFLVLQAKDYYNRENAIFTDFVNRYNTLSFEEKNKVKKLENKLNGILKILKPLVSLYDPEIIRLNQELRDMERTAPQKLKNYRLPIENLRKVNIRISETHEKIENLKTKIADVKEKINSAKSERNKNIAQKKSNLRVILIKYENEMKKIENKIKQLEKIKENSLENISKINQEKFYRLSELDAVRSLNEKQIREKNALLKSLEFERVLSEIRAREEKRIRQEELLKQQIEEAEKVYQQEKIINDQKIQEAKKRKNIAEDREEWKIEELAEIKKKIKTLKTEVEKKNAELHKKDVEIEYRKKITDEKIRQNFENQGLQRNIEELNTQKDILQKISDAANTYTENTKKEISARQDEIEKTIKLNLESLKEREANILAEESKIKLDVFQTLSEVKEQTATKLDLEKKMQDLKDEIIRKQDVSDLLSETVEKIENNEISEAEEYNAFLESEIEFKKKLEKKNLTLAEYKEIATEEKEDVIERLENVKSKKLKAIYNIREKAIESQMKIILTEGADNLKNNLFSLKFEIENLKRRKEISERKEDLAKFQSDNFKRELNLRKQEIELLKNIRLKVLETERKTIRNEASTAISDMIKSIEKDERNADVREKLDEMLDDVENKEIDQKSKSTLYSLIDKIENKEIHEAAKEKLNFILGKIELHDNIDESKKALDKILDKIEDESIKKDVEEKIDEILDDVELEDYDFLDEEDEFDDFLSVKKHLSEEKKMQQFSKIDTILSETKKLDDKLKMDENIEMKDLKPNPEESGEGSGETSFDEFNDYNFFINNIEDPLLRERTRTFLGDVDAFDDEKEKIPKIKNAYKSAINKALWEDKLDLDYWDGNIIQDEKAKFHYEQKVNNLNIALGADYNIHIDPTDQRVREFLDINLTNSTTEKLKEINGYIYNGEKIISRNIKRNFYFENVKKTLLCQKFIDELKNVIDKTAKSQIANESYFEKKAVKDCALEYIGELREEQSYQIDSARNSTEMRSALREANDIDKEIKDIKKNSSFKMRMKIFRRTLSWRFTKLLRLLWKNKKTVGGVLGSLIIASIGVLLNQLGVIAVVHNLKKAARSVKQYADDVHETGKRIMKTIQSLYRVPGGFLGFNLMLIGTFLRILYYLSFFAGGASASWVFGIFGGVVEISLYFDTNIEILNEKAADVLEETGNVIENAGIRSQKYISKNLPVWYYDIPKEERNILQTIEAGAIKAVYKVAEGTQSTGEVIHEAADFMRNSYYYMKIIFILFVTIILLIIVRDLFSLTIIKNGKQVKKSSIKRRKKT